MLSFSEEINREKDRDRKRTKKRERERKRDVVFLAALTSGYLVGVLDILHSKRPMGALARKFTCPIA